MLLQKKIIPVLLLLSAVQGLVACSSQPDVYLQIANYEKQESDKPYYTPLKKVTNGINDEMTAYIKQVELIESTSASYRASRAISELSTFVKDTIDTNNTVANMELDSILDTNNPLEVGMKFADNWTPEKMEKIREISDEKIAKAKESTYMNLSNETVSLSAQGLGTKIEKLFEGQTVINLSDESYSNYYDVIARSTL